MLFLGLALMGYVLMEARAGQPFARQCDSSGGVVEIIFTPHAYHNGLLIAGDGGKIDPEYITLRPQSMINGLEGFFTSHWLNSSGGCVDIVHEVEVGVPQKPH